MSKLDRKSFSAPAQRTPEEVFYYRLRPGLCVGVMYTIKRASFVWETIRVTACSTKTLAGESSEVGATSITALHIQTLASMVGLSTAGNRMQERKGLQPFKRPALVGRCLGGRVVLWTVFLLGVLLCPRMYILDAVGGFKTCH